MHGLPLWLARSRFHPGMEKHAQAERVSLLWTRLCVVFFFERRTSPLPSATLGASSARDFEVHAQATVFMSPRLVSSSSQLLLKA